MVGSQLSFLPIILLLTSISIPTMPLFQQTGGDFTMQAIPPGQFVNAGDNATSMIVLANEFPFKGLVNLTATVSPLVQNGPLVSLDPSSAGLFSDVGSDFSFLRISTSTDTPWGAYEAIVTAMSGSLSHSINVSIVVPPFALGMTPQDELPDSLEVSAHFSIVLTVSSLDSFSGEVNLAASSEPVGLSLTVVPGGVSIPAGRSAWSSLIVAATAATPTGVYRVTVTASGGGISRSAQFVLEVVSSCRTTPPPCAGATPSPPFSPNLRALAAYAPILVGVVVGYAIFSVAITVLFARAEKNKQQKKHEGFAESREEPHAKLP
jgi:hypothetical protein